jgi:hypothetical protein
MPQIIFYLFIILPHCTFIPSASFEKLTLQHDLFVMDFIIWHQGISVTLMLKVLKSSVSK